MSNLMCHGKSGVAQLTSICHNVIDYVDRSVSVCQEETLWCLGVFWPSCCSSRRMFGIQQICGLIGVGHDLLVWQWVSRHFARRTHSAICHAREAKGCLAGTGVKSSHSVRRFCCYTKILSTGSKCGCRSLGRQCTCHLNVKVKKAGGELSFDVYSCHFLRWERSLQGPGGPACQIHHCVYFSRKEPFLKTKIPWCRRSNNHIPILHIHV